jgi:hypothetical protein
MELIFTTKIIFLIAIIFFIITTQIYILKIFLIQKDQFKILKNH